MGEPGEVEHVAKPAAVGRATEQAQRAIDERQKGLKHTLRNRVPRAQSRAFSDAGEAKADAAGAAGRIDAFVASQTADRPDPHSVEGVEVHGGGFEQLALESSVPGGFPVGDDDGTVSAFASPGLPEMTPPQASGAVRPGRDKTPNQTTSAPSSNNANWAEAWLQMHGPNVASPIQDRRQWEANNLGAQRQRVDFATIDSALTVARYTTYQQLADAGLVGLDDAGLRPRVEKGRVIDLVGGIIYVGPGFAVALDTQGQLAKIPLVGWSFRVRGLTSGRPSPWGVFVVFADRYVKVAAGLQRGDPHPAALGQIYRVTSDGLRWDERAALKRWAAGPPGKRAGVLIVASPSFQSRRGMGAAMRKGPGRLMDAISRCVVEGYLEKAVGKAIDDLTMWEIAKSAFVEIVKTLIPLPSEDELEDSRLIGMAVGMAIWGSGNNRGDIDAAARLLAPVIAGMFVGLGTSVGVKRALKGAKTVAPLVRGTPPTSDSSVSPAVDSPTRIAAASPPGADPPGADFPRPTAAHLSNVVSQSERGLDGRSLETSASPAAARPGIDSPAVSTGPTETGISARLVHQLGRDAPEFRTPAGTSRPTEITPDSMVLDLLLAPREQLFPHELEKLARLERMGVRRADDGNPTKLVILPQTWAEKQAGGRLVNRIDSSAIRTKTIETAPNDRQLGGGERGTILGELQHRANEGRDQSGAPEATGNKRVLELKDDVVVRQVLHVRSRNSRVLVTADKDLITRLADFAVSSDVRARGYSGVMKRYLEIMEVLRRGSQDGFEVEIAGHTMVVIPL